ncbi:MAG TPA: YbdK family carboxylate-amine ligase [Solirubrobacteraceae bacterium]|nr:YbdK family carboxylate-amine ligase [Solirubrobacteraceae bacterium]
MGGRLELVTPERAAGAGAVRSAWARWHEGAGHRYTLGVEEEVMLLDGPHHRPAPVSEQVRERLPADLAEHVSLETHAAVLELATGVHGDIRGAVTEISDLRRRLARELRASGLAAASVAMHPLAGIEGTRVCASPRYRVVSGSMRWLAHRDPTLALHVHVGVPDPEDAVRLLNRLRESVPILLALSANSPYRHGEDTGFASTRAMIFGGFPRTGTPRPFSGYADYVQSIEPLIDSGAVPDPSFLWWDVRLAPRLGTVEVRVMDAQTTAAETAALAALVQSLARLALEEGAHHPPMAPEVVAENCFLAARDGMDARLVDPASRTLVSVRTLTETLVDRCRPHAAALGCAAELAGVHRLACANGAMRQRSWRTAGGDLRSMLTGIVTQFAPDPSPLTSPT